jgi:hypothetical protein
MTILVAYITDRRTSRAEQGVNWPKNQKKTCWWSTPSGNKKTSLQTFKTTGTGLGRFTGQQRPERRTQAIRPETTDPPLGRIIELVRNPRISPC